METSSSLRPAGGFAALACALTLPCPALAQESASIDAQAILVLEAYEPPPSVLELRSLAPLTFGYLQIPNGRSPGSKCVYTLSLQSQGMLTSVEERDSSGNVIAPTAPESSGCGWTFDGIEDVPASALIFQPPSLFAGLLFMNCDKDREISFSAQYQNGSAGVFFNAPPTGRVSIFTDDQAADVIGGGGTGTLADLQGVATCTDNNDDGQAGLAFALGGQLTITENATDSAGQFASVGTILFEASY